AWKTDLRGISLSNRQMMFWHMFFIELTVFLMGLLCLTESAEIVGTPLGRRISFGLAIFWTTRLLVQFFGYSPALWRGKRFETAIHILMSILWTYVSSVFSTIASTSTPT